ncbi:hypothetical protein C9374_009965 [Naegleria lovaniensis]|uniref:mitogen-activated protein kinase kinase n=1 Tax=Naegleria lovaniensis TaxID=51637 RepID=A0AA88GGV2_NAELO|nr:uncharacterized protein C9374_009965 [Naegleria lovaniensis]KAG2375342.1 hypothetical protein C9374_009965 [Naegleria lovaniensis]
MPSKNYTTCDESQLLSDIREKGVKVLENVSESMRSDKTFMMEAVKQRGDALKYASDSLKNDKDLVLEAAKQNSWALYYASDDLKKDKLFILEAVKHNGYTLNYAFESLKRDKEVVLEAIHQDGRSLRYASDDLKKDKPFILQVVKQNGRCLAFVSENLKKDKEIVLEAVKQRVMELASVMKDPKTILEKLNSQYDLLNSVASDLRHDNSFMNEVDRIIESSVQICSQDLNKENQNTLLNRIPFMAEQTNTKEQTAFHPMIPSFQPPIIPQRVVVKLEDQQLGTKLARVTVDSNFLFKSLVEQVKLVLSELQNLDLVLTYWDPTFGDMFIYNDQDVKDFMKLFQDTSMENSRKFIRIQKPSHEFVRQEKKHSHNDNNTSSQIGWDTGFPDPSFAIHSEKSTQENASKHSVKSSPALDDISTLESYLNSRYDQISFIDSGGFGSVFRVVDVKSKIPKALKLLKVENPSNLNDALKEVLTMAKLSHVNIVRIYDAFLPNVTSHVCIEMELMKGSLKSLFLDKSIRLPESMLRQITKQVCAALNWMFTQHGMLHRDIKPGNVLVRDFDLNEETIQVVLGDFGLAKPIDLISSNSSQVGTLSFMAPELMNRNLQHFEHKFSVGSDMFALGVTIFQLMTMNTSVVLCQYFEMGGDDIEKFISTKIPSNLYSREFIELVAKMLKLNPSERIFPIQVVEEL